MDRITEIKRTLSGRVDRFACDVWERSGKEAVLLYRLPTGRDVHGVWLPDGTLTVAYFWQQRPFNLYHWVDPSGATLAYYFNVGDVECLERDTLEWHDLAVDVLATPDGRVRVLDEEELPPDMDPILRRYVDSARDQVLAGLPRLTAEANRRTAEVLKGLPTSPWRRSLP